MNQLGKSKNLHNGGMMEMKRVEEHDHIHVLNEIENECERRYGRSNIAIMLEKHGVHEQPLHIEDLFHEVEMQEHSRVSRHETVLMTDKQCIDESGKPLALRFGEPLHLDDCTPKTLQEILKRAAKQAKDKGMTFVYEDGHEEYLSYQEMLADAERLLKGLRNLGIQPGESILFQFKDNKHFVTAFWACILGGFLPTPLGTAPIYSEQNAQVLKLYNTWQLLEQPIILTEFELKEEIAAIRTTLQRQEIVIHSIENVMDTARDTNWFPCTEDTIVLNLLTSGSTGVPKCVQHKSKSIIARTVSNCIDRQLDEKEVSLNWMPLDHVGGIVMCHIRDTYLMCQQVNCLISAFIENPLNWLHWIDAYSATFTWAPNFAFSLINQYEEEIKSSSWNLSSMRYIVNGGEAVISSVGMKFLQLLQQHQLPSNCLIPTFGMSEVSSGIIECHSFYTQTTNTGMLYVDKNSLDGNLQFTYEGHQNAIVFTEVGRPMPGIGIRIVDEDNQCLSEDRIGRFQIHGPTVMNGYFKNDEANAESFTEDGWFDSGDLGFIHNGNLVITGRKKDMIVVHGANYYNYEIEALVEQVPGVETTFVCATSVKSAEGAEELAIFFVPVINHVSVMFATMQQIKQIVARKMGITPKVIIPIQKEAFFKTDSGKITRNAFQKQFENGAYREITQKIDCHLQNEKTLSQWFYREKLVESKLGKSVSSQKETYVFFRQGKSFHHVLKEKLTQHSVVIVDVGETFGEIHPNHYQINPKNKMDYVRLFEELAKRNVEDQVFHLLHAWNYCDTVPTFRSVEDLANAQYLGVFSVMFALQAIMHAKLPLRRVTVIATNSVGLEAKEMNYSCSTLEGYVKTLPAEFENLQVKYIDIEGKDIQFDTETVWKELQQQETIPVVLYRDEKRYKIGLEKVPMLEQKEKNIPFQQQGFYIITGGLGGLGTLVAKLLLERYSANVLLLGRTEIETNAEKMRLLDSLKEYEQYGGTVQYKMCNVMDLDAMRKVVHSQEERLQQKVNGIIHLAGIIQEILIEKQTEKELHAMFEAKVYASWVLHEIVKERQDCLYITTSSARTLLPGMTISAYCSANRFVENFAYYQRSQNVNSYCFSWSFWNEIGMGTNLLIKNALIAKGFQLIDDQKGIYSLLAGLKGNEPNVFVGINHEKEEMAHLIGTEEQETQQLTIYITPEYLHILEEVFSILNREEFGGLEKEIVILPKLPLDEYGKVDQTRLAHTSDSRFGKKQHIVPRNDIEEKIAFIWEGLLNKKDISVLDHFFELGGDSLKATQMISALKKNFAVTITQQEFFQSSTVEELASLVEKKLSRTRTHEMDIVTFSDRGNVVEMSSAQKRQWFLYEMDRENPYYNNTLVIRLTGEIHLPILRSSIIELVNKHETLRTTFVMVDGIPSQIIADEELVEIEEIDLKHLSAEETLQKLEGLRQREANTAFKIENSAFRAKVILIDEKRVEILLSVHHIVSDGWSMGILVKDIAEIYEDIRQWGESKQEPLPIQYADYTLWQNEFMKGEEFSKQLSYWKEKLAEDIPVLDLPLDKPRPPIQTYRGKVKTFTLHENMTRMLKEICQEEECTLFMLLLSAFSSLLHRYTGQEDLVVGSLVANRNREQIEKLIGFFVNTLPLRINLHREMQFTELLSQVKKTTIDAYDHQDVPFELLVDELQIERDSSRNALFQVLFVLQNAQLQAVDLEKATMELEILDSDTAKFDMSVQIFELEDTLSIKLEYNTDLFFDDTIERFLAHYETILASVIHNQKAKIGELSILPQSEYTKLVSEWNEKSATYNGNQCIHELFEAAVHKTPSATALIYRNKEMTYEDVNAQANALAHKLRDAGVGPNQVVGVLCDRSFEMVVGILAVLKAGGAYLPIDTAYPMQRTEYVLQNSEATILLTKECYLKESLDFEGEVFYLDDARLFEGDRRDLQNINNPTNLAYIIYTSGSTGNPKGVMVAHQSVVNLLLDLQEKYPVLAEDKHLLKTTYTFDVSVAEIFGWFHAGGTLVIAGHGDEKDPEKLIQLIQCHKVTHINFVPSMLHAMLQALDEKDFAIMNRLKYIIVAGEAVSPELCNRLYAHCPNVKLENLYGPTEGTIYATGFSIHKEMNVANVPIGKPLSHVETYILDQNNQIVPIGVPGELCLGGICVAKGYMKEPVLTEEKFVVNPMKQSERMYRTGDLVRWLADGNIEYLGRIDNQVKIRGFRIELGEIEAAIAALEDVVQTIVTTMTDHKGANKIVAYVVSEKYDEERIREHVKKTLPQYMVPSYFVSMKALPLNKNGKVDRKQLHSVDLYETSMDTVIVGPRNEKEAMLSVIWQELLGLENISVHDNFFKLGGDSILAIQMIRRVKQQNYYLNPKQIFQYQTIAELASKLQVQQVGILPEEGLVTGEIGVTPIQQWYFEQDFVNPHHWNLPALIQFETPHEASVVSKALAALLTHHDALRLIYRRKDGKWVQRFDETLSTVSLDVFDAFPTGEEALYEVCEQLQRQLNITEGPVLKAALFNFEDSRQALFIAVHHLVVDGVSWRILFEDIMNGIATLERGEEIVLPKKTNSFKQWTTTLSQYANTEVALQEYDYWMKVDQHVTQPTALKSVATNTEEQATILTAQLDSVYTEKLMKEAHNAFHTEINDLLLTALYRTIVPWDNSNTMAIYLEGHGREEIIPGMDLSRTVGWFTTLFPVCLASNGTTIAAQLMDVKETLRKIPNKGIGYGILKYMTNQVMVGKEIKLQRNPGILFNYLGELQKDGANTIALASKETGIYHCPKATRETLLDFNLILQDGRLNIYVTIHQQLLEDEQMKRLADVYVSKLKEVIDCCLAITESVYTPSDFPLASLTQQQLDALPVKVKDIYPLSPVQKGMLFHSVLHPESTTYFGQVHGTVTGTIDVEKLEEAWNIVVERHPILSTIYMWEGLEEPIQIVINHGQLKIHQVDISQYDESEQIKVLEKILREDRQRPFQLDEYPLIRVALVKKNEYEYELIWSFHHISIDGWSIFLVLSEVVAAYKQLIQQRKVALPDAGKYKSFIEWTNEQDQAKAKAFWKEYMKGFTAPTSLLGKTDKEEEQDEISQISLSLTKEETEKINHFVRQKGYTLNTIVQGALALLVRSDADVDDIVFGVTVSGRNAEIERVNKMAGLFINTLPLRVQLHDGQTLQDVLTNVQQASLDLREYEYSLLTDIKEVSEIKNTNELFQCILVFENYPIDAQMKEEHEVITLGELHSYEKTNYDLTFIVIPGEELIMRVSYEKGRWDERILYHKLQNLKQTILKILDDCDVTLSEFTPISAEQESVILQGWSKEAQVLNLVDEQEEIYRTVNENVDGVEIFILDAHAKPVPVGVPGEIYIATRNLYDDCGEWADWMEENAILNTFTSSENPFLYKTGDIGIWTEAATIKILELI